MRTRILGICFAVVGVVCAALPALAAGGGNCKGSWYEVWEDPPGGWSMEVTPNGVECPVVICDEGTCAFGTTPSGLQMCGCEDSEGGFSFTYYWWASGETFCLECDAVGHYQQINGQIYIVPDGCGGFCPGCLDECDEQHQMITSTRRRGFCACP